MKVCLIINFCYQFLSQFQKSICSPQFVSCRINIASKEKQTNKKQNKTKTATKRATKLSCEGRVRMQTKWLAVLPIIPSWL